MTDHARTRLSAWQALAAHAVQYADIDIAGQFAADGHRFERYSVEAAGVLCDYSKHRINDDTRRLLVGLAEAVSLQEWIARLFRGERINTTEHRAVLHTALRSADPVMFEGRDVTRDVARVRAAMRAFSEGVRNHTIRSSTGEPYTDVVNIGIGGSDLGPALAAEALAHVAPGRIRAHFMSNVDGAHVDRVLDGLDPAHTLIIVASKTFTTSETMTNARTTRAWLRNSLGDRADRQIVAVTANAEAAVAFGVDAAQVFEFWDWVGGRYSMWSAVGLPIALAAGADAFDGLCAGAREMDRHFASAQLGENIPVILGLLSVWYTNFLGAGSHAVLPYDDRLRRLPDYLQQLEMESLGKHVSRDGESVGYTTGPVIWGSPGTNGQHAFHQLLHQGTGLITTDFIAACAADHRHPEHHRLLLSNCIAQSEALMTGRSADDVRAELSAKGMSEDGMAVAAPHRVLTGNRPSTTLVMKKLTPEALGALIALYEHKVFVQSVIWDVNAFDQWGVELGKQLAGRVEKDLSGAGASGNHDGSTNGLITYFRNNRGDVT
jgi:glucose-6-phosphate isomerase